MFLEAYQLILLPVIAEAFSSEVSKMTPSGSHAKDTLQGPSKTKSPEEQVNTAATACIEYWLSTTRGSENEVDGDGVPSAIHKDSSVVALVDGAATSLERGMEFSLVSAREDDPLSTSLPQENNQEFKIISTKILPVGAQNVAVVHSQM